MDAVITALSTDINATSIWGAVEPIVPFVGVMILVSLGLTFLRRAVKGASKGKARF